MTVSAIGSKRLLNNEMPFSNRLTEQTLFINNICNIKKYFQKECLDQVSIKQNENRELMWNVIF